MFCFFSIDSRNEQIKFSRRDAKTLRLISHGRYEVGFYSNGFVIFTFTSLKSSTFLVTRNNPSEIAVAEIIASGNLIHQTGQQSTTAFRVSINI